LRGRPIWDLHEMPFESILRFAFGRRLFRWLLVRCDVIVCNEARLDALEYEFRLRIPKKLVLRNFPSEAVIARIKSVREARLEERRSLRSMSVVVGIAGGPLPGRYGRESIEVVRKLRDLGIAEIEL